MIQSQPNYVEDDVHLQKIKFNSNGKTLRRVPTKKIAQQEHLIKHLKSKLKFGVVEQQIVFENEAYKFTDKQKKNNKIRQEILI